MNYIEINKSIVTGRIKPMNCVNNFPVIANDLNDLVATLKIPYSRLHDTASMNSHLVDVPSVFPDFDADENDEKSYDFAFTDYFIKRLNDLGIKAFYRLGVTIENYHDIKAYHIYPPKDYEKWARICEHIILHYNFGWANGFYFRLNYWEIWNEPDNFPDIADNQMWKGTFEQYIDLYEVAAKHLKSKFPDLKIGGYASCGFYAILEQKAVRQANSSSRTEYFIECAEKFLAYARDNKLPLDFFSWHSYSGVKSNIAYAKYARKLLDEYGFTSTESILNEWNPGTKYRGTLRDASNILANMLALQDEPLDMLMYYDIRIISSYCGLFNPLNQRVPFKAYYVFMAFSELYDLGEQIKTEVYGEDIYAVSAYKNGNGACLITNNSEKEKEIDVKGITVMETYLISEKQNLEKANYLDHFTLNPFESILIKFNC